MTVCFQRCFLNNGGSTLPTALCKESHILILLLHCVYSRPTPDDSFVASVAQEGIIHYSITGMSDGAIAKRAYREGYYSCDPFLRADWRCGLDGAEIHTLASGARELALSSNKLLDVRNTSYDVTYRNKFTSYVCCYVGSICSLLSRGNSLYFPTSVLLL